MRRQKAPQVYFAMTYGTQSNIEISLGRYKEAILSAHKALQIYKDLHYNLEIASIYNRLGVGHYFLYDYDSTKYYYEKSYAIKKKYRADNNELAISSYNLAIAYEDLEQVDKALELYKEAEKYLLKTPEKLSFLSDVYIGMAHLYNTNQELTKAQIYAEKAMQIGIKSYGEFNPNMTFVYTIYGNILTVNKEYKKAIIVLEKALKIRLNTYGENHKWTCESYYDLARAQASDNQLEKAESNLKRAITIGKKTKNLSNQAQAQATLAKFYIKNKRHEDLIVPLLQSSTQLNDQIYGKGNIISASNYISLAEYAKNIKNEKMFFQSIQAVYEQANYLNGDLRNTYTPFEVLEAMAFEGIWYEDLYKKTHDKKYLLKKVEILEQQQALIRFAQNNFSSDNAKILFANDYHSIFESGLNTCWELYKLTKEYKYLEKAFELSDANRNNILLSGIQDNKYKQFSGISEELLLIEEKWKKELNRINMAIYDIRSDSFREEELGELLSERIIMNNKLDSLQRTFQKKFSEYSKLKYAYKPLRLADVQAELESGTQILTYFLGEENLYTISIERQKVKFYKSRSANRIKEEIKDFQKKMVKLENLHNESTFLFEELLEGKLNESYHNLVIVPDNSINYLPFEALKDKKGKYLIERYAISYAGSIRLMEELNNPFFNYKTDGFWAGFAPEYLEDQRLKGTLSEVENISKLFKGKTFYGQDCTKENFIENNKNYSVLHLAMHGEIDHENPLYNRLEFDNGDLTLGEISAIKIRSNMAVLSACNTGFGKIETGEGVMSLARAFHFAGVPAIIMSLWKVPDKETAFVMTEFYKNIAKKNSKATALRKAKLAYLKEVKDPLLSHPFYWSGFVLSGNVKPLETPINRNIYIAGTILLGLVIFVSYKKWKA
ncbi:MAG: CHAT domain-containing tetratricopeptide repeat protein [Flavobacteriaceae bacterium]|nr:CHAT domain-containing tetratricopeptide repeat protein [Flavobacteriaceae bacterium]